jgi:putative transposase
MSTIFGIILPKESIMGRVHYTEEQIIANLRKAELLFAEGKSRAVVCKALSVSPITLTRWQSKYGSMSKSDAKRLKDLEKENNRLKKIVADQALDISVLKDFAQGNF